MISVLEDLYIFSRNWKKPEWRSSRVLLVKDEEPLVWSISHISDTLAHCCLTLTNASHHGVSCWHCLRELTFVGIQICVKNPQRVYASFISLIVFFSHKVLFCFVRYQARLLQQRPIKLHCRERDSRLKLQLYRNHIKKCNFCFNLNYAFPNLYQMRSKSGRFMVKSNCHKA